MSVNCGQMTRADRAAEMFSYRLAHRLANPASRRTPPATLEQPWSAATRPVPVCSYERVCWQTILSAAHRESLEREARVTPAADAAPAGRVGRVTAVALAIHVRWLWLRCLIASWIQRLAETLHPTNDQSVSVLAAWLGNRAARIGHARSQTTLPCATFATTHPAVPAALESCPDSKHATRKDKGAA